MSGLSGASAASVSSMTVLVDEARWEWRGVHWAHLVSDESYEELHEFAQSLGKRRLGFQGDHYDIDRLDQQRAVRLGAELVEARDLVRRLVAAGLRRRGHKPSWERVAEAAPGVGLSAASLGNGFGAAGRRLLDSLDRLGRLEVEAASVVYADDVHLAALLDLAPGTELIVPDLPAVDELWVSHPRVDGERSVELLVAL